MKAKLMFNIGLAKAKNAVKALSPEVNQTTRVDSRISTTNKGLEILIKTSDLTSLRAAINTWIKLYESFSKMSELKCQKKMKTNHERMKS